MGFNKKIVGPKQIELIEQDLKNIKHLLRADCIIFETQESKEKFKIYEKKFNGY